jgi:hypothetical protein
MNDIGNQLTEIMNRVKKGITAMVEDKLPMQDGFNDMGKQPEKKEMSTPPVVNTIMNVLYAIGIIGIIVILIAAAGAARLSLCYNSYLGTTGRRTTLAYAALAFVFFPLYYPYYGLCLNPICLKRIGRR